MICHVLSSPCGQGSLAFGAVTVAAVTALVIFELVAPNSFASAGGFILYTIPGVTACFTVGFFIGSVKGALGRNKPAIPFVIEGYIKDRPMPEAPKSLHDLFEEYKANRGKATPKYEERPLQMHWADYQGSYPQQKITYEPTSLSIGIELRTRFMDFANDYDKEKCQDLQSTAEVLGIKEEELQELFEFGEFPKVSWKDPDCLEEFFIYLPYVFDTEGNVCSKLFEYDLNLETYFEQSHPFWPKTLAPSQNQLTIKQFADFLCISIKTLKRSWKEIESKNNDELLSIEEMQQFCTEKKRLSGYIRPRIWDAWYSQGKVEEKGIFIQGEVEAL